MLLMSEALAQPSPADCCVQAGISLEFYLSQLAALVTFFGFPALFYWAWKCLKKRDGRPEIWFIPKYRSFRLVIRNLPRRMTFFDLKSRAILREMVLPTDGTSVATYRDIPLVSQNDLFLFPGNDQVLISFRLQRRKDRKLEFLVVDKFGREQSRHIVTENHRLICDYIANVKNILNFDIKLKFRAEITAKSLSKFLQSVKNKNREVSFQVDRLRDASF